MIFKGSSYSKTTVPASPDISSYSLVRITEIGAPTSFRSTREVEPTMLVFTHLALDLSVIMSETPEKGPARMTSSSPFRTCSCEESEVKLEDSLKISMREKSDKFWSIGIGSLFAYLFCFVFWHWHTVPFAFESATCQHRQDHQVLHLFLCL